MLLKNKTILNNVKLRSENFQLWIINKKLEDRIQELEYNNEKSKLHKKVEKLEEDNRRLLSIIRKKDKEQLELKKQLKGYEQDEKINEE